MARPQRDVVIRLIAVFKLVKAAVLTVIGVGALSLRAHRGPLDVWIHALVFDPHGRYFHGAVKQLSGLDTRQLDEIVLGSLVYAAVFCVEGVGLMLRKTWAELLTVIITTSFIPLEIYELTVRTTWAKLGVIAANVAIVVYLVRRRRRERR